MAQSCGFGRAILPKSGPSNQLDPVSLASDATTTPRKPVPRGAKSATKTDQEWDDQKPNIYQFYVTENLSLEVVMRKMEEDYHFKASRKQYRTKIKEWGMDIKNIKNHEMQAIVRKDRKRKAEDPLRESEYRVNGQTVEPKKIERFMERWKHRLGDIMADTEATPPHITCYTPYDPRNEPFSTALVRTGSSSNQFVNPMQTLTEYGNPHPDDPDFQLLVTEQWILKDPRSPSYGRINSPYYTPIHWSSCKASERSHGKFPNPKYCTFPGTPSLDHCGIMLSPYYSPPYRRSSTSRADSPTWFVADIAQPDLSPFDWYGSYINHFSVPFTPDPTAHPMVNRMLEFVAKNLDTYEDQRQYEDVKSHPPVEGSYLTLKKLNGSLEVSLVVTYEISDSFTYRKYQDNFPFRLYCAVEAFKNCFPQSQGPPTSCSFYSRKEGSELGFSRVWEKRAGMTLMKSIIQDVRILILIEYSPRERKPLREVRYLQL